MAWVILLSVSVQCFIEGIAFVLILRGEFGGGVAVLTAILMKLIPQKLGYAAILLEAGLTHFWENVLSLIAVSSIFLGMLKFCHPGLYIIFFRKYFWKQFLYDPYIG